MLDVSAIERRLGECRLVGPVRALRSVASTNDIAWAWAAAGCPEGAVFFAEEQVQGRGRFGRTWHCPHGAGLLLSIVLRPSAPSVTPAHLTALAALAVAEAVEETAGLAAAIRWPNDVTVHGRKLAGVLVERRGGQGASACVVGIGLNVNVAPEQFPEELRATATSLSAAAGREFAREAVAAALLRRFGARYAHCADGGWHEVAAAWRRRCVLVGERVALESAGAAYHGRVLRVDPVAGIELELDGGERRAFAAEAATITRPPALAAASHAQAATQGATT